MSYKVFKNHTEKEFKEKYSKNTNLVRLTKKEVEQFGKDNALLGKKSWWLIGDTYYEVPSNGFVGWWKGLKPAVKGVSIGGLVAVVAAAITVPLVLLNGKSNPIIREGEVSETEWVYALGTSLQIGRDNNFVCNIKNKHHEYTYTVLNNKAICNEEYYCYYDLKDDYGYWEIGSEGGSLNDSWEYHNPNDLRIYKHDDGLFKPFYMCATKEMMNNNFKYDATTKSYIPKGGSGSGGSSGYFTSIKFNKNKQIEEAISTKLYGSYTYTFTYGNAVIEDFPELPDNSKVFDLSYSNNTATSQAHSYSNEVTKYYRIDMEQLGGDPTKLNCQFDGDDLYGYQYAGAYKNGVEIPGVAFDYSTKKFTIPAEDLNKSDKLVVGFRNDMDSINSIQFKASTTD